MLINKILLKNTKNHKLRISAVAALLALGPMTVMADQVINDDLIVVGNACIGLDCSEDMVFNTDTLLLKENNTRLALGGANEFQLTANDSANFGINEFRIESFKSEVIGMDRYVAFSGDDNMVVLGAGSEYQSGAVSVGSASLQRSVKEVGDAVAVDDLINLSQLQGAIGSPILDLEAPIQTEFTRLNSVSAMTAAMSALQMNPRAQGPMSLSVGVGAYEGERAAAVGLQWRTTDRVHFQVGFAASNATSAQTSLSIKMHW